MSSYRTIFKSSAIVGGAQIFLIIIGIIRTKVLALLLGPAGMGLVGLYSTATTLIGTVTNLGIGNSGVRVVAEAAGSGDNKKISHTVMTLRRMSLASGIIGMLCLLAFSFPLSWLTFGDKHHVLGMALMSLTLLFTGISSGQTALLQGLRRLKELASSQILGALFGTIVSIILVYALREDGVAAYLVAVSAFSILTSWWYARKIRVENESLSFREIMIESRSLLGMGMAFMISALLTSGVAYGARVLILWQLGKESVGLYQATWALSSLYVSFVLNAMALDFFPRLTAVANDNTEVNRMVNEQTEMGLLISTPGVLATITLAPWILSIFYSSEFIAATEVIRWQIIGIALRVVSWPLGFIQLAKGKGALFVITEIVASVLHIILLFAFMKIYGLIGVGISFALLYVCYSTGIYFVCHSLSDFIWSNLAKRFIFISISLIIVTFASVSILPQIYGVLFGLLLTILSIFTSISELQKLMGSSIFNLLSHKVRVRMPRL